MWWFWSATIFLLFFPAGTKAAADFYGFHNGGNETVHRNETLIHQEIATDDEISDEEFSLLMQELFMEEFGMFDNHGPGDEFDDYDPYLDPVLGYDWIDPEFKEFQHPLSFQLPPMNDHFLPLHISVYQDVTDDDEIEYDEDSIIQNPHNIVLPQFHPMHDYMNTVKRGLSRKRREALIDTLTVHNPQEWWNDIDSGLENAVTKKLVRTKAGIGSQYLMLDGLDHYSPTLHLGDIDSGYLRYPEYQQASDRTFGQDADFYIGDMHAFKFTPQGERYGNFNQLLSDVKSGNMVVGRRYILNKIFFSGAEDCFINKNVHLVQDVSQLDPQQFVDPGSEAALQVYWTLVNCQAFIPGTYKFLFIKQYTNNGDHLIGFQDMSGRQFIIKNPNFYGMQAASPYSAPTGVRSLYKYGDSASLGPVTTYGVNQVDISHITNSQYINTGARMGMKSVNTKFAKTNSLEAPYDESSVWQEGTHRILPNNVQENLQIKQAHINNQLFNSPYEASFDYGVSYEETRQSVINGDAVDVVRRFINQFPVDEVDKNGETILFVAALNGRIGATKALLKAGADINKQTNFDRTALMAAARFNKNVDVVELLLEKDTIDLTLQDIYRYTAYDYALVGSTVGSNDGTGAELIKNTAITRGSAYCSRFCCGRVPCE